MGAAAFIMAETLGLPYATIAFAATIPGILYFVAVGVMVHFEAKRPGLPLMSRADLPALGAAIRRGFPVLAAPAVLVSFIVDGRSPMFAGWWALLAGVAASWVRSETRIGLGRMMSILVEGAQRRHP